MAEMVHGLALSLPQDGEGTIDSRRTTVELAPVLAGKDPRGVVHPYDPRHPPSLHYARKFGPTETSQYGPTKHALVPHNDPRGRGWPTFPDKNSSPAISDFYEFDDLPLDDPEISRGSILSSRPLSDQIPLTAMEPPGLTPDLSDHSDRGMGHLVVPRSRNGPQVVFMPMELGDLEKFHEPRAAPEPPVWAPLQQGAADTSFQVEVDARGGEMTAGLTGGRRSKSSRLRVPRVVSAELPNIQPSDSPPATAGRRVVSEPKNPERTIIWKRGDDVSASPLLGGIAPTPLFPQRPLFVDSVPCDRWGRAECSTRVAIAALAVSTLFPPAWLLLGSGYFDGAIGVVPRRAKQAALVLGASAFIGAIIISVAVATTA